ncbi:hypothetical protein SASPL_120665 [Salvia splendens]|uniref:Uncharacterized protein n=1 Tax=Salvia splendens TaxID=180675 RepID=A0A8X8XQI3_SALSN|nr:hypothetical protein SASPL_120665 [Salvia splendens]
MVIGALAAAMAGDESRCVSRVRVIPSATFQCESYLRVVMAPPRKYPIYRSSLINMASQQQDRSELDAKARQGETVVPGGTGGKSFEAQEHLAEAVEGRLGGSSWGRRGYQEMGRKEGLSTGDKSGGERAEEEGVEIDE